MQPVAVRILHPAPSPDAGPLTRSLALARSANAERLDSAFRAAGADWVYTAFDVAPADTARALDAMRTLGLAGLSITMPHKEHAARAVDPPTASVGACSTERGERARCGGAGES